MKNVLSSAFNAVYSGPADEAAPMSTEERAAAASSEIDARIAQRVAANRTADALAPTTAEASKRRRSSAFGRKVRKPRRNSMVGAAHAAEHIAAIQGYLLKKGSGVLAGWAKRFVYISTHYLSYKAAESDAEPLGGVDLRGEQSTIELLKNGTVLKVTGLDADEHGADAERVLRVMTLKACSKSETLTLERWYAVLQRSREGMRQHALDRGVVLIETPPRPAAVASDDDGEREHHGTPPGTPPGTPSPRRAKPSIPDPTVELARERDELRAALEGERVAHAAAIEAKHHDQLALLGAADEEAEEQRAALAAAHTAALRAKHAEQLELLGAADAEWRARHAQLETHHGALVRNEASHEQREQELADAVAQNEALSTRNAALAERAAQVEATAAAAALGHAALARDAESSSALAARNALLEARVSELEAAAAAAVSAQQARDDELANLRAEATRVEREQAAARESLAAAEALPPPPDAAIAVLQAQLRDRDAAIAALLGAKRSARGDFAQRFEQPSPPSAPASATLPTAQLSALLAPRVAMTTTSVIETRVRWDQERAMALSSSAAAADTRAIARFAADDAALAALLQESSRDEAVSAARRAHGLAVRVVTPYPQRGSTPMAQYRSA